MIKNSKMVKRIVAGIVAMAIGVGIGVGAVSLIDKYKAGQEIAIDYGRTEDKRNELMTGFCTIAMMANVLDEHLEFKKNIDSKLTEEDKEVIESARIGATALSLTMAYHARDIADKDVITDEEAVHLHKTALYEYYMLFDYIDNHLENESGKSYYSEENMIQETDVQIVENFLAGNYARLLTADMELTMEIIFEDLVTYRERELAKLQ